MAGVLDASLTLEWALKDARRSLAERVLVSVADQNWYVPSIWPLEVANGLRNAERRGRIAPGIVGEASALVAGIPVVVESMSLETALGDVLTLAREQGLTAYDAAYLELAVRRQLPLGTLDEALRVAAVRVGVPLL